MRYVGGKARIAGWIADAISPLARDCHAYVEPFVGGAATLSRIAPWFDTAFAGDAHEDLILMWQAVQGGWTPPEHVTRDQYEALRHSAPSALRGFVGYGASFSGKWFGGYVDQAWDAYHGRMTKPYAQAASRAVVKDAARLGHVVFKHRTYSEWTPTPGTLVYCDPPYSGVTGYGAVGAFDSAEFWRVAREWADSGATVVVSEYVAPDGWRVLAERERSAMLRVTRGKAQESKVERLFVRA